jgi:hypothetical protein
MESLSMKVEKLESMLKTMIAHDYFEKTPISDAVDEALTRNPPEREDAPART